MRTQSDHEVGKLISYFENYVNDLNKDLSLNSKTNHLQQIRTTSQNTSHLTYSFAETIQVNPTIIDNENIYDCPTYQTLIQTNSFSSPEQSIVRSIKQQQQQQRRRQISAHQTAKKRLQRRRPPQPTYIKELKAYLAHRQSSVVECSKISDVKKFSNVLVWLSNQTATSPVNLSDKDNETTHSITPDSAIVRTQSDVDSTTTTKYLTYQQIKSKLKIRKEVFSPMESFDDPLLIELIYNQIVRDIFSSKCIRISDAERTNMRIFLSSHGVFNMTDIHLINEKTIKKEIVEQARQWLLYFCRLFPIESNDYLFFAIGHSAIRFIQRNRTIESYTFDRIERLSLIEGNSKMNLYLMKKRFTIQSNRIQQIRNMLEKYLQEFRQTFKSDEYSIIEYAVQYFQIPNKRQTKKNWKTLDCPRQNYNELVKWSNTPIEIPLRRDSPTNLSRQCFLVIMRFMGDYPRIRNQSDFDCILFLLKNLRKHGKLIDEIFCQLLKQLTDNQSSKNDSREKGWLLLSIILNYFIPTNDLRICLCKFFNDHRNEKFREQCSIHYEQTLNYGGRKTFPIKPEIDLLISNTGKHQLFLLPGGLPLTIAIKSSTVINDCLRLLCDHLEKSPIIDSKEYSIFLISTTKYSSRLLSPHEYLFDIINDCFRSRLLIYHFILKRMLWYHIPIEITEQYPSDLFIEFMYYQLLPEFREGLMINCKNNHLSDELINEISLLAAIQYRISNRTNLPTMREVKCLLPSTVLQLKAISPQIWTNILHEKLRSTVFAMSLIEAKRQFLIHLQSWPLFGTTFFRVEVNQSTNNSIVRASCFVGINKTGLLFVHINTRETILMISYENLMSISSQSNHVDIKYGNTTRPDCLQCQIKRAQDMVFLVKRYWKF